MNAPRIIGATVFAAAALVAATGTASAATAGSKYAPAPVSKYVAPSSASWAATTTAVAPRVRRII